MKAIEFKGKTLETIRDFPGDARQMAGYELDRVQRGFEPSNWKPMKSIGPGVKEIRISANDGVYRVIYVAKFSDAVYVLSAFQKKQQKTPKEQLAIAKKHYGEILK
jgi:phage-related protein